ncbi:hypothetical protein GCM10010401_04020 [Rarobacter faecitabidus]|uniref:Uncharacterized protein n=1 Tax=Rarobacter faecitabidus TaxID=13243 RepID=A0A542ZU15_RARFA|nr:hypothetical protein [Rarobacter faecitabidus]TQL63842.1 hypothetical protein FB461_0321 [Rarobacter faecitabidus]
MLNEITGRLLAASQSPAPVLRGELKDSDIAPGVVGFLVTFAIVCAGIVLMVSLSRRIRRIHHADHANHTTSATFLPDGSLAAPPGAAAPSSMDVSARLEQTPPGTSGAPGAGRG